MQVKTDKTAEIGCPTAPALAEDLKRHAASVGQVVADVMELADACGATQLDVILDSHQHPQQFLLQAGLAELQGPALCFSIPGAPQWPEPFRLAQQWLKGRGADAQQ